VQHHRGQSDLMSAAYRVKVIRRIIDVLAACDAG
jgi:hypothetical protein